MSQCNSKKWEDSLHTVGAHVKVKHRGGFLNISDLPSCSDGVENPVNQAVGLTEKGQRRI